MGLDLTTMQGVVAFLTACTTTQEYDRRCLEVKAANGGLYPDFWPIAVEIAVPAYMKDDDGPNTDPNQIDFFL